MNDLHDTQPKRPSIPYDDRRGLDAPPRILFWGMIGLFVMVVGGGAFSLFAFNNILNTGQQQRIVEVIPFMDAFLVRQPTPEGGILPTPELTEADNTAAMDLLAMPAIGSDETDDEDTASDDADDEAVEIVVATDTPMPTATSTPIPASPTALPATPTVEPTMIPTDVPTEEASTSDDTTATILPPSARMFGFRHYQQTWNNCGPATITMALSYYGWQNDQEYAASFLKPVREDKNVSPHEMVNFVNERTAVRALWRMGGDIDLLKNLIHAGFPVVIETGLMPEAYDWIGHYRALVAYDDTLQRMYMYDSFLGKGEADEGIFESYAEVDDKWRHFNRIFIVVYEPVREAELMRLLGELDTMEGSATVAFNTAQAEARQNPQDSFAWFNMGTSLVELGRHEEAANAFDQARRFGLPFRMTWYQFGPFVAYYETGRFDDVMALARSNLNNASELEETYYWRGRVMLAQGDTANAAAEFRRALRYNPNFREAREALQGISG